MLIVGHDRFLTYYDSEFAGRAMDAWSYQYGVQLEFIRPGKPVDNSYIESFNGRLRDECLNVETFFDLNGVREKLSRWQLDYNQVRPHSALGDRSPEEFVREWQTSSAAPLRTAGPANNIRAGAVPGSDSADPKPLQLSGSPPDKMKGEAERLPSAPAGKAAATSNLLETLN